MKYISYSITLRPKGGILDSDIDLLKKFTVKYCKFYMIITEKKDDERHVHAALYLKKEQQQGHFNRTIKNVFCRMFEERESIWGVAYKGKPMYNDDFVSKYMQKDDDTVVVESHLPDIVERCSYYRDTPAKEKVEYYADPYYQKLKKLYVETVPEGKIGPDMRPSNEDMHKFLYDLMYKHYKIKVISDHRKFRRVCKCLRHYVCRGAIGCYPFESGDVESEHTGFQPV